MTSHFTLRMAWHDNMWNGTICQDPERNSCCVGSRSVLSDRIAEIEIWKSKELTLAGRLTALYLAIFLRVIGVAQPFHRKKAQRVLDILEG